MSPEKFRDVQATGLSKLSLNLNSYYWFHEAIKKKWFRITTGGRLSKLNWHCDRIKKRGLKIEPRIPTTMWNDQWSFHVIVWRTAAKKLRQKWKFTCRVRACGTCKKKTQGLCSLNMRICRVFVTATVSPTCQWHLSISVTFNSKKPKFLTLRKNIIASRSTGKVWNKDKDFDCYSSKYCIFHPLPAPNKTLTISREFKLK